MINEINVKMTLKANINYEPLGNLHIYTQLFIGILLIKITQKRDRHDAAIEDARLTEDEFNDPEFRAACRKFKSLQDSHRSIRLLKAAECAVDKLVDYFHNVDIEERDPLTGKPIFKAKDIEAEMTTINKVHESLVILENQVKKEISETTSIRAGAEDGFLPNF